MSTESKINLTPASGEVEFKRRLEQLHLLLDIARNISSQLDLRELISAISDCLREVLPCEAFWMTLIDSDPTMLRVFALDPKFNKSAQDDEGLVVPIAGTLAEKVINSRQTLMITRADLESSTSPTVQRIAAQGIHSSCLAPLIARDIVIGVISMASRQPHAFTEEDSALLTLIAGQIAIAVDNAFNFARAREAEDQANRQSDRLQLLLEVNNAVV